uniref:Uncharacterized protein n=1 Tax=Angiostrongylus cantonensis TaxID=6313 RepID=A0A0K0DM82_ANGCA
MCGNVRVDAESTAALGRLPSGTPIDERPTASCQLRWAAVARGAARLAGAFRVVPVCWAAASAVRVLLEVRSAVFAGLLW